MRKRLEKDEKKQKISISINSDLNTLIEEEMKKTGKKKSQIIENVIKTFTENNEKSSR